MMSRIALATLLGASILGAQTLPDRPEKLVFKPLVYKAPLTKDYKTKLKNGIPVYIAPDPSIAFVRMSLQIRGGSYQVPVGKEGLASLMGSQWRAGGTEATSAAQLDERLEFLAGNIFSGFGATEGFMNMSFLAKDLDEGLKHFMEVLTKPAFAQDRLDLAKKTMRQGLERRNDSVQSISGYINSILLNGEEHFSGRFVTAASLDSITRDDLKALHAKLLHPGNFVISVSGKFDKKEMLDKLNATLGALKPAKDAQVSPKVPAPKHEPKPGIYVVDKDVPQASVSLTLPGLRRSDADWFPAMVMNELLGGGSFTARLLKKVRTDEGLTYGIYSNFDEGPYYPGEWSCGLQTKNRSVAYALRLILAEMERIKKEPASEEELKVTKGAIINGFPSRFSSKGAVVNTFAGEAIEGWPEDYYATFREKVQAVTAADIQRVAQKYLDASKSVITVVGKVEEAKAGDEKDHPGLLKDVLPLPLKQLPLRDPLTMKPLK